MSAFMIHHVMKKPNAAKRKKKQKLLKKRMKFENTKGKRQRNAAKLHNNASVKKELSDSGLNCDSEPLTNGIDSVSPPTAFDLHFENKTLMQWMINPFDVNEFFRYNSRLYLHSHISALNNTFLCLQPLLGKQTFTPL